MSGKIAKETLDEIRIHCSTLSHKELSELYSNIIRELSSKKASDEGFSGLVDKLEIVGNYIISPYEEEGKLPDAIQKEKQYFEALKRINEQCGRKQEGETHFINCSDLREVTGLTTETQIQCTLEKYISGNFIARVLSPVDQKLYGKHILVRQEDLGYNKGMWYQVEIDEQTKKTLSSLDSYSINLINNKLGLNINSA